MHNMAFVVFVPVILKQMKAMSTEKCRSRRVMSRPNRFPSQVWRSGRFCCVFHGIGRQSSNISCLPMAKLLIRTCTLSSWIVWRKQSHRSALLWPTGRELCFIRTTILTRQKNRKFGWEVLMYPSYSSRLTPGDYYQPLSMVYDIVGEESASREACENW